ncbi:MAG: molecular chaperone DnaJ [Alphaproteobacteria bacterium]|nr:molecular chaperone DnaJ [Alphaproteobacteria bacterium]
MSMPPNIRRCDHPECGEEGKFPAPQSRQRLREYYWFCLDHVRDYNRKWDYYAGMKPEEIELELISDITWNRPSWAFGMAPGYAKHAARYYYAAEQADAQAEPYKAAKNRAHETYGARFSDPFDLFRQAYGDGNYQRSQQKRQSAETESEHTTRSRKPPFEVEVKRALGFFDLVPPFSEADLKTRFKQLVKIHHPDANLGDKAAEERLKQVIADYHFLRQLYHPPT